MLRSRAANVEAMGRANPSRSAFALIGVTAVAYAAFVLNAVTGAALTPPQ